MVGLVVSSMSALFALTAAAYWYKAGIIRVSPSEADNLRQAHMEKYGRTGYAVWTLFDGSDLEFTLSAQAKYNRYGALSAAGAAVLQAVGTVIGSM